MQCKKSSLKGSWHNWYIPLLHLLVCLTGATDPFFEITVNTTQEQQSQFNLPSVLKIYRSPVQKENKSPTWDTPLTIRLSDVGGMDGQFTIRAYDWDKDGSHPLIGTHTTSLREFTFGPLLVPLVNPEKAGR